METVKNLGAAICAAAFAAGVLELLFPEGSLKSVINVILALYILASALNTVHGVDHGLLQKLYQAAEQAAPCMELDDYAAELYKNALEETAKRRENENAQMDRDS